MTQNDILRRLRYALQINDAQVARMISRTGEKVDGARVASWLKSEEVAGYEALSDRELCRFLDGLIIEKRGLRPDARIPEPLERLSTNEILRKLRIALEFRDEDMTAVFERVGFVVTKSELSSFFRKEGHRNFRKCPSRCCGSFSKG